MVCCVDASFEVNTLGQHPGFMFLGFNSQSMVHSIAMPNSRKTRTNMHYLHNVKQYPTKTRGFFPTACLLQVKNEIESYYSKFSNSYLFKPQVELRWRFSAGSHAFVSPSVSGISHNFPNRQNAKEQLGGTSWYILGLEPLRQVEIQHEGVGLHLHVHRLGRLGSAL